MLKNLSDRERKLAILVMGLVPLCVVFFGFMSFVGAYNNNKTAKQSIQRQIDEQIDLRDNAMLANVRREYYRQFSLPSDTNRSITQYKKYVQKLAEKECGLKLTSIREKGKPAQISFIGKKGRTKVFDQVTFTLRGSGRLAQVTKFLHKFYSLDLIHRISEFSIEPASEGLFKLTMNIDVASMADADKAREFEDKYRPIEKPLAEYDKAILYRNMFGPPNVAPTISKTKHSFKPTEDTVSFKIEARDPDENDILSFELGTCPIAGAKLEPKKKEKDKHVYFSCPKLAPGDYEFEVKVTDNGAPSKSDQITFTLTIEANAAPKITSRSSEEMEEGMADISFKVEAKDSDRRDRLTFEMVSSEIEGASFKQTNERNTYATFKCPAQPVGEYRMVFRVTDDAPSPKSDEQEFVLTVIESTKPRFAPATKLSGISTIDDVSTITLHVRPTNEFLESGVGESFELDEMVWTVRRIDPANWTVEIECDGYLLTYNMKSKHKMLDNPLSRTKSDITTANDDGESGRKEMDPKVSTIKS